MSSGFDPSATVAKQPNKNSQAKRKAKTAETVDKTVDAMVTLTVPCHQCFPGYATASVDCRLTSRQAAALKVLWSSLSDRGERYQGGASRNPGGTPVENAPSAIRWLLDRLGDAIETTSEQSLIDDYKLQF